MWLEELSNFYENNMINEHYKGIPPDYPKSPPGVGSPTQGSPTISYQNNKVGIPYPDSASMSQAGNVPFGNPYEQEEGIAGQIDKKYIFDEINSMLGELHEGNPNNQMAILMLSRLKKKIT